MNDGILTLNNNICMLMSRNTIFIFTVLDFGVDIQTMLTLVQFVNTRGVSRNPNYLEITTAGIVLRRVDKTSPHTVKPVLSGHSKIDKTKI